MNLTVATKSTEKPKGSARRGRRESPEWAVIADAIQKQKPGEWVTYEQFDGTHDAVRVGLRLRNPVSFEEGKAFAPIKGRVKVAMIDKSVKDGKETARLAICYLPNTPAKVVKTKSTSKKVSTKK